MYSNKRKKYILKKKYKANHTTNLNIVDISKIDLFINLCNNIVKNDLASVESFAVNCDNYVVTDYDKELFDKAIEMKYNMPKFRRISENDSILHIATKLNAWNIVVKIVEKYPSLLDKRNSEGYTPLHFIMITKRIEDHPDEGSEIEISSEIASLLVSKNNINANATKSYDPILLDVITTFPKNLEFLIEKGAEINTKIETEQTLLHYASSTGNYEAARILIENGADLEAIDEDGMTPLHTAILNAQVKIAELLISKGANIEAKINDKVTLKDWAMQLNVLEIVDLLEVNSNIHQNDNNEILDNLNLTSLNIMGNNENTYDA